MRVRFLLFFVLVAASFAAGAPSRDYFADALPSLCSNSVGYSVRADFLIRQDIRAHPAEFVSSLLLGLSYAEAIRLGEPARLSKSRDSAERISAKRLTFENAETLLRTALERLSNPKGWSSLDLSRYQALKSSGTCGFRTDAELAKRIQKALSGMNAHRQAWLPSALGASAKARSKYDFEGYFLLGPLSEIRFPALSSSARSVYDLSGGKASLRRPSGSRILLAPGAFGALDDTYYSFRAIRQYTFGGVTFHYLFVTSDVLHTDGLSGKLIALEAGHYLAYYDKAGGTLPDTGSVMKDASGNVLLTEVGVNRQIRAKLVPMLQAAGARVLRDPKKDEPGNARVGGKYNDMKWDVGYHPFVRWVVHQYNSGNRADAFVSIHHNVRDNARDFDYTEAYFGGKSIGLGRALVEETVKSIHSGKSDHNPLIPTSNNERTAYVNDKLPTPVATVLLEVQFTKKVYELTDAKDAELAQYAHRAATGIFNGLSRYFKGDFRPAEPVFKP